jgi:hypothetical protein
MVAYPRPLALDFFGRVHSVVVPADIHCSDFMPLGGFHDVAVTTPGRIRRGIIASVLKRIDCLVFRFFIAVESI